MYHDLHKEHWRNITRCIINEGPYEPPLNLKRLGIPVDVWLTMDKHKKVRKLPSSRLLLQLISPTYDNDANNSNNVNSGCVMPDFEASGLPSSYKTDWDGAKYYVQNA